MVRIPSSAQQTQHTYMKQTLFAFLCGMMIAALLSAATMSNLTGRSTKQMLITGDNAQCFTALSKYYMQGYRVTHIVQPAATSNRNAIIIMEK